MKKQLFKHNNAYGFSLIETMITISILGFVSLAIFTGIDMSNKTIKGLEAKLEQIDFSTSFKRSISLSDSCQDVFSAATIPVASLSPGTNINLPTNQINFEGNLLSNHNFQFFENLTVNLNILSVPAPLFFLGTLTFNLNPKHQYANNLKLKPVKISFAAQVDATGAILRCPNPQVVLPTFVSNDCRVIDRTIPEGQSSRGITTNCDSGYSLLYGLAVPDGSEDGVGTGNLRITTNSIWVYADDDSWRVLGRCCRDN